MPAGGIALPDDACAPIIEHGDVRSLLISDDLGVDAKAGQAGGEAVIELARADTKALAIGSIVVPNDVTAVGFDGNARKYLVSWRCAREGVFAPQGGGKLREHAGAGKCRREARHYTGGAQQFRHINLISISRVCCCP